MDTTELIKQSRARFDHNIARKTLKEKYDAKLIFALFGGMWRAGPELLALLQSCTNSANVVLEDLYGNPIKVDTEELRGQAFTRWQEQMNAWLIEYSQINTYR